VILPPVTVTAPAPLPEMLPRSAIPGLMDVLTRDDVRASTPRVLPDAIERLPGVTLQNEQGSAYQPNLTLRGFVASPVTGLPQGVSVFLDGVRLNEPTVEEVNFDLIPLEDAEKIEVIRGPSVLFGRNTLGAAVNITTRRGEERFELAPEMSGGSFARQNYRLRLGGMWEPLDYYVSLAYTDEAGWRDASEARIGRAFGKIGVQRDPVDVTLSYQYSNDRIKQAGSLPQALAHRDPTANLTAGDFFAPELNLVILNARYTVTDQLTVAAQAFFRALDSEQFNVNLIAQNTRLLNQTRSGGGRVQGSWRRPLFGRDNLFIVGAEYTRTSVTSRTFQEEDSEDLVADLADNQTAIGVYAQDTLTILRGFWGARSSLVFTVAGRWDYLNHAIEDRLGGPSGGTFAFNRFNPRAGLNLNVSERLGFFASYGEGFRAPALLELTCAGPGAICPGLQAGVAPDPQLNPVVARTYEVGASARPLPWLDVDLSLYRTNVTDDIFSVSPTGTVGVFFQNVASTRREGLEFSARGRVGSRLEAQLNYTYTRATFRNTVELATPLPPGIETVPTKSSFPLVPNHRLNVGAVYHPWSWLTLSLGMSYVGPQFLRGDEANEQARLPSYVVVNGGISARWRELEGFVNIYNLLNHHYETFGTFARDARSPGAPVVPFVTPAQPINVVAGLRYTF
jgi:iron complex outermembrane receptor protein